MIAIIHRIATSWHDVLSIFTRQKLYPFILVSLNATKEIYRALGGGAWWVFVFLGISFFFGHLEEGIGRMLLLFMTLCAARSSAALKNSRYFLEKLTLYFPLYLLFDLMVITAFTYLGAGSVSVIPVAHSSVWLNIAYSHIFVFLVISAFFLLDSGLWWPYLIRTPKNALLFMIYNYPVLAAIEVLRVVLKTVFDNILQVLQLPPLYTDFISVALWLIYMPLIVSLLSNLYIKRMYDQNRMYLNY